MWPATNLNITSSCDRKADCLEGFAGGVEWKSEGTKEEHASSVLKLKHVVKEERKDALDNRRAAILVIFFRIK